MFWVLVFAKVHVYDSVLVTHTPFFKVRILIIRMRTLPSVLQKFIFQFTKTQLKVLHNDLDLGFHLSYLLEGVAVVLLTEKVIHLNCC